MGKRDSFNRTGLADRPPAPKIKIYPLKAQFHPLEIDPKGDYRAATFNRTDSIGFGCNAEAIEHPPNLPQQRKVGFRQRRLSL
jgi:hypothetical protein